MLDPAAQPGLPPLFPRLRDIKFLRLCSSKSEKDVAQATTDLRQALGVAAESMLRADGSVSAPRLVIISTHQSCQLLGDVLRTELARTETHKKAAGWKLDLLVCDEAHKTACNSVSREAYWV